MVSVTALAPLNARISGMLAFYPGVRYTRIVGCASIWVITQGQSAPDSGSGFDIVGILVSRITTHSDGLSIGILAGRASGYAPTGGTDRKSWGDRSDFGRIVGCASIWVITQGQSAPASGIGLDIV